MTDCPNCQHPQHLPGTECDARIDHGPSRFHACLCLARPGAANACPPQMTCQGGTLGYADIWYLQHGHTLSSDDGAISPEVLADGPASAAVPSVPAIPVRATELLQSATVPDGPSLTGGFDDSIEIPELPAVPSVPADADLRDRVRRAICEASGFTWHPDELMEPDEYGEHADAVLAVLPELRRPFDAQAKVRCTCGGWFPIGHLHADTHQPVVEQADRDPYERVAAAKEQQVEAHSSLNAWRVELYDPGAEEWVPGSSLADLATARARLANARERSPKWKDNDTHVQRRIVRETTTYTVEARQADTAGEA